MRLTKLITLSEATDFNGYADVIYDACDVAFKAGGVSQKISSNARSIPNIKDNFRYEIVNNRSKTIGKFYIRKDCLCFNLGDAGAKSKKAFDEVKKFLISKGFKATSSSGNDVLVMQFPKLNEAVINPKPLDLKKLINNYKSTFSAFKPKVINKPTLQGIEIPIPELSWGRSIQLYFHLTLDGVLTDFTVGYDRMLYGDFKNYRVKEESKDAILKLGELLQDVLQSWSKTYGSQWTFEEKVFDNWVSQSYVRKLTKAEMKNLPKEGSPAKQKLYKKGEQPKFDNHPEIGVGTIFSDEWGYSMMLVDYYIVTSRTNATLTLAPIGSVKMDSETGRGHVRPNAKLKIVTSSSEIKNGKLQDVNGEARVRSPQGGWIRVWNGKDQYYDTWD